MALLQSRSRIFPIDRLLQGMERLANSIVRVGQIAGSDFRITSTGFFIAPSYVIVPGYSIPDQTDAGKLLLRLDICRNGLVVWSRMAELVEWLGNEDDPGIALLRVPESEPTRVLDLSFDLPTAGAEVAVVQYAGGSNDASISFGEMLGVSEYVEYDADTAVGSSGAPVLDKDWRVIAMHVGSRHRDRPVNYGISCQSLLNRLENSSYWLAIATFHKVADDRRALEALRSEDRNDEVRPGAVLIRAALVPWIDSQTLSESDAAILRPLVASPRSARWALRMSERRRIIASAGPLIGLKKYLVAEPTDPAARVIADILDGPPYRFQSDDEEHLSWWIQIVRWFDGIAIDLPNSATVARLLERRRVRGRLKKIIDGRFRGRSKELARLHEWYDRGRGPLTVSGIGGIGKSSLVAQFASELDERTPLFWLDFDRADLAPDDATSVLSVLSQQAAIQLDRFVAPSVPQGDSDWRRTAEVFSEQLSSGISAAHPPLIVLDSFEAAQYSVRYQELWPVLEVIGNRVPSIKVCVTGRAPIPALTLLGVKATPVHLKGMAPDDARKWLYDNGISIPEVVDKVLELAQCIPLIVRLAIRFIELGGRVDDLPRELPSTIVAGYLYDRILDRVQDSDFKPLASALLILRRATEEMFLPLFEGLVALPPGTPSTWFAELSREMGLVDGGSVLQPRPEVRAATLSLLDHDMPTLVRSVDERAVEWYSRLPKLSTEAAAELVYHSLRIDDLASAERAWRDGVGAFLTFAADEIPDSRARNWLQGRLGTSVQPSDLNLWEAEAAERIRGARRRNLDRIVQGVLIERKERSASSPLLVHDAFELSRAGRVDEALNLLERVEEAEAGSVERDRRVMRAWLWRREGHRERADELLRTIQNPGSWPDDNLNLLTLIAARLALSTDLDREADLLEDPEIDWLSASRILAPIDVLSPSLRQKLSQSESSLDAPTRFVAIDGPNSSRGMIYLVDNERARSTGKPNDALQAGWSSDQLWKPADFYSQFDDLLEKGAWGRSVAELALAGRRRWWIAAGDFFLQQSSSILFEGSELSSQRGMALLGVLAAMAMGTPTFSLGIRKGALSSFILEAIFRTTPLRIPGADEDRVTGLLDRLLGQRPDFIKGDDGLSFIPPKEMLGRASDGDPRALADLFFAFSVIAPDPLDALVNAIAGYL